jgi:hypothetical protein
MTPGRWLLRYKIVNDVSKRLIFNESFQFKRDVVDKINASLNFSAKNCEIVHSEDTGQKDFVIRIRFNNIEDDYECKEIINTIRLMG